MYLTMVKQHIDGQSADNIFLINPGVTVTLQNLILTHGDIVVEGQY